MAFLMSAPPREPFLHAPAVVLWLIGGLIAVHMAIYFGILPDAVVWALALVPERFVNGVTPAAALPLVSHVFLHGGFMHLGFNCLWLLAFGPLVARRYGAWLFLLFFFAAGLAGGLTHLALNWGSPDPVVGASGAIAGLMGGGLRMIRWPGQEVQGRLAPIFSRQILMFSGLWLVTNLLFGLIGISGQTIAWQAHMGGYFFGLFAIAGVDAARYGAR
jgi:Uncharacterized membrane protein (homolog of Drosophila rhomboid)